MHDIFQARAALLGGILDRILSQCQRVDTNGVAYDIEDDVRNLTVTFDGEVYAKQIHCEEDLLLPWVYPQDQSCEIPAGMTVNIIIRARDSADMQLHFHQDVRQAAIYRVKTERTTFILVPNDFMELLEAFQQKLYRQLQSFQIGLMHKLSVVTLNLCTGSTCNWYYF